jgi:hypothetical protein
LLFAVIYWAATSAISDQLDGGLDAEGAALEEHYNSGCIDALSSAITEGISQPVHSLGYLLKIRQGKYWLATSPTLCRCASEDLK